MRLGYFGGSFDPPHRGHLAVAQLARDRFQLDRVLLAPTGRQPLKPGGPEAPFADRLRMTELLCAGQPGLQASAIDAPAFDGTPNYTVDTLRRLHAELAVPGTSTPSPELFAILGADAFLGLRQWRQPDELLRLANWIIVSRPGSPLPNLSRLDLTPAQRTHLHLLTDLADPTSATDLRARLHAGLPCTDAIPASILALIRSLGLYGTR